MLNYKSIFGHSDSKFIFSVDCPRVRVDLHPQGCRLISKLARVSKWGINLKQKISCLRGPQKERLRYQKHSRRCFLGIGKKSLSYREKRPHMKKAAAKGSKKLNRKLRRSNGSSNNDSGENQMILLWEGLRITVEKWSQLLHGEDNRLGALTHILKKHIMIFSGSFPDVEMGKEYKSSNGSGSSASSIMLSYHKHAFGLGTL
ncbi:hypothetical protein HAX54_001807 [Datura stramonium]|uniref:OTU domain-containing protein n=1 Tax=Datura stramonium TaxID=4076 RepID=A0ABS8WQW8_DATST|nr:hypothetical protein [Datura stramonium]